MASERIPVFRDSYHGESVVLDGNVCVFKRIRWNETDKSWYMDFENATEGYSLNGIKLVPGCDLLLPFATPELGALFIIDSEGKNQNPDFDGFGDRYVLMYIPLADLA